MDIYRTQQQPLTALERPKPGSTQRTPEIDEPAAPPHGRVTDRRVQPDRRRRQEAFDGPDRRKRKSRRSPLLLHPRTAESAPVEDRRGRLVSTKA